MITSPEMIPFPISRTSSPSPSRTLLFGYSEDTEGQKQEGAARKKERKKRMREF